MAIEFTLEVYKADKRKKSGERRIDTVELVAADRADAERYVASHYGKDEKMIVKVFETNVTRLNLMSKMEYTERYDTPLCCSPSSETYWSM